MYICAGFMFLVSLNSFFFSLALQLFFIFTHIQTHNCAGSCTYMHYIVGSIKSIEASRQHAVNELLKYFLLIAFDGCHRCHLRASVYLVSYFLWLHGALFLTKTKQTKNCIKNRVIKYNMKSDVNVMRLTQPTGV